MVVIAHQHQHYDQLDMASSEKENRSTKSNEVVEGENVSMCTEGTPATPAVLVNTGPKNSADCVRVAVRIRPLLEEDETCIQHTGNAIRVGSSAHFQFDQVFGPATTQESIYDTAVAPLVEQCLCGYNATCLAYGQTGSGKTHTIMGSDIGMESDDAGVIPRALNSLFQQLDGEETQVSIQFLELYGEEIRDLLTVSKTKLNIREINNEPEVVGATSLDVDSVAASLKCLQAGLLRRVTGATAMNSSSSRSHAILTVRIQQPHTRSKLHFVDLAGAERHKRTAATGKRLKEGIDINRGLSNLGNVIQALTEGRSHVPYRDAKLTRLLQGSLGGNHKTAMIACVSPAVSNMGESVNCLRYANRAKKIENTARVNDVENGSEKARIRELEAQLSEVAADAIRAMKGEPAEYYTLERLNELVTEKGRLARRVSYTPKNGVPRPSFVTDSCIKFPCPSSPTPGTFAGTSSQPTTPAYHETILDVSILEQEEQLIEEQKGLLSTIQSAFHGDVDATISESVSTEGVDHTFDSPNSLMRPHSKISKVASALEELSQSIEVKERLIEQIKQNKEREDAMRKFYEEQLDELHSALQEKETERDQLLKHLEDAKEHSSDDLKDRLKAKERQIESLRKVQLNYKQQTAASARAAADLNKLSQLQSDVKLMKRRKADMQKELAHEKRMHQKELNRLNKVVVQKDRKINKIQKASTQHQIKAEKATAISKNRLEELAQLKKTLRRYKKEVGLDPVMVGKRQSTRTQENDIGAANPFDADKVRDYFDEKVAIVVRKEALVDKLAKEWEEYFELYTELNQLEEEAAGTDDVVDSRQTLQLKIQFVNDKIRKTAKRLGNDQVRQGFDENDANEFMFDDGFMKLLTGRELSGYSKDAAAKVLFGMVVRERRRVASLAKTASSLDERVQIAEKTSATTEAALRSYVNEHSEDLESLQQKHQEHIISLMEMVTHKALEESSISGIEFGEDGLDAEQKLQKQLLVLANERVENLETQLSGVRNGQAVTEEFDQKLQETEGTLSKTKERCDWLEQSRNDLRSVLRQIRHEVGALSGSDQGGATELSSRILALTDSVLHPIGEHLLLGKTYKGKDISRRHLSPRLHKHIELMHSSDSDCSEEADDEEDPVWAANIMADLALIAEGKVPPSLSPQRTPDSDDTGNSTVFDRLANPSSYTGTQKRRVRASAMSPNISPSSRAHLQDERELGDDYPDSDDENHSKLVIAVPSDEELDLPQLSGQEIDEYSSPMEHQSVFDRLFSPSYFTGTQKNRLQESKARRDRSAEDAANRVLEGLLDEDADKARRHTPETSQKSQTIDDGDEIKLIPQSPLVSAKQADESQSVLNGAEATLAKIEYTKQNVFDRLQKTTTQSAAVRQVKARHNEASAMDGRPNVENRPSDVATDKYSLRNEAKRGMLAMSKGGDEKHERPTRDYTRQNVFERLTKTSTEAFSKKIHQ